MKTRLSTPLLLTVALGLASACQRAEARTGEVGDEFKAFVVKNCESGDRYCQVCRYSGKPTVMAVLDVDDPAAEKDLARLQALYAANEAKGLTAFVVFGRVKDGKFVADDDSKTVARLDALRQKLKLTFPVTVIPTEYTDKESSRYKPFVEGYAITKSRTLMFANASNDVKFAEVIDDAKAEAQFASLSKTVAAAL